MDFSSVIIILKNTNQYGLCFFLFSNRYNEFIQKRGNTTRINNLNSIPNGQYPTPNGQYPGSNRQYPSSNRQYPIPNRQYPIPNRQYPTPNRQYPTPYRQYPIPNGQYPTPYKQYPIPNGQYPTKRQHTVLKNCRSHFRVLAPEASGLREIKYNLHIPTKKLPCISKHISNTN